MSTSLSDESVCCPFCRSDVKAEASVCAACGAFQTTQGVGCALPILTVLWFAWGPMTSLFALMERPSALIIGAPVTIVGWWLLKKMYKEAVRPIWKRRH